MLAWLLLIKLVLILLYILHGSTTSSRSHSYTDNLQQPTQRGLLQDGTEAEPDALSRGGSASVSSDADANGDDTSSVINSSTSITPRTGNAIESSASGSGDATIVGEGDGEVDTYADTEVS